MGFVYLAIIRCVFHINAAKKKSRFISFDFAKKIKNCCRSVVKSTTLMLIRECQQPRGEILHLGSSVQTQELFAMLARVASLAVLELMTDIIISASCHRYVCVAWYVGSLVRWFHEPFSRALGDVHYVCQASLHTSLVPFAFICEIACMHRKRTPSCVD
jgi:hypothetical protein